MGSATRGVGGFGPPVVGLHRGEGADVADLDRSAGLDGCGDLPGVVVGAEHHGGPGALTALGHPGAAGQVRDPVHQAVQHGERHHLAVLRQRVDRTRERLPDRGRRGCLRDQVDEDALVACGDDPLRRLETGVEDPFDVPAGAHDRAEVVVEVRLLEVPPTLHRQEAVGGPHRLTVERPTHLGPDDVPDVGPHLRRRSAERPGVLVPGDVAPGRVVEQRQLRPPVDGHRVLRSEADAGRRAQLCRPVLRVAERRRPPVEALEEGVHLASAREDVRQIPQPVGGRRCGSSSTGLHGQGRR